MSEKAEQFAMYFWSRFKAIADGEPGYGTDYSAKLFNELKDVGETLDACASVDDFDDAESAAQLANDALEKYKGHKQGDGFSDYPLSEREKDNR